MSEQEEPIIIIVTGPDGEEKEYVQDIMIPFAGKQFAFLVAVPQTEEEQSDPEIILARIETDASGEAEYVPPTDEEYDAVAYIYNEM